MKELNIYDVDLKYVRDLHNADDNVMSQSPQIDKDTRSYVGIIVMLNGQNYCIPLTSGNKAKFQKKNNNVDLLKIPDLEHKDKNGAPRTLAVLNINNMIPVDSSVISKFNLKIFKSDSKVTQQRKSLLQKEIKWCRANCDLIERRVQKVYSLVVDSPDKNKNLTKRCCDFKKLEAVLEKRLGKSVERPKAIVHTEEKKPSVLGQIEEIKTEQAKSGYNKRRNKNIKKNNSIDE